MTKIQKAKIPSFREELLSSREEEENICPILSCVLDKNKAVSQVLDHCHKEGYCRDVIALNANSWLGRVENNWYRFCDKHTQLTLPEALRNVADYLERDYSHMPEHPEQEAKKRRRVRRWKDQTLKDKILAEGGEVPSGISRRKLVDLYIEFCT